MQPLYDLVKFLLSLHGGPVTGATMSERQHHLLRLLRREPSSTTLEAARFAGCSTRAAWVSLCNLAARGLVTWHGRTRAVRCWALR